MTAVAVEPRELGVVTEARHHLLEPLELRLGPVERAVLRARRAPRRASSSTSVPIALNVRRSITTSVVTVSGGRLTTRTVGRRGRDETTSRSTATPGATAPGGGELCLGRCDLRLAGLQRELVRGQSGWSTTCCTSFASARSRCSRCARAASRGSGFAVSPRLRGDGRPADEEDDDRDDDRVEAMARISHLPQLPRSLRLVLAAGAMLDHDDGWRDGGRRRAPGRRSGRGTHGAGRRRRPIAGDRRQRGRLLRRAPCGATPRSG